MNKYSGMQTTIQDIERQPSSSLTFTMPPLRWSEFTTLITYTQHKRGQEFIDRRVE